MDTTTKNKDVSTKSTAFMDTTYHKERRIHKKGHFYGYVSDKSYRNRLKRHLYNIVD